MERDSRAVDPVTSPSLSFGVPEVGKNLDGVIGRLVRRNTLVEPLIIVSRSGSALVAGRSSATFSASAGSIGTFSEERAK